MRIGIDARELCGRPTGVGRYLAGLLRHWVETTSHEFVLYAPEPLPGVERPRFAVRVVRGSSATYWQQIGLPRRARRDALDVLFAPAYAAPLMLTVPTVVAIHDISFVAHPEWFRWREGLRRRWLTRSSARRASAVITISEFSRRELIERLGVPAGRVHVIPPGIDSISHGAAISHQPSAMTRVLYVGSIFTRRHVPDLIRGFAPIARAHRGIALDIVGENRSYPFQDLSGMIASEGLSGVARWHAYASEPELQQLYATARAFAFLSEYEGLGLTPLEALASGIPPVLLDTPVARECCGDAAIYVSSTDAPSIAAGLEAALFDSDVRSRTLAAAPHALAKYDWSRAAAATLAVLERAAGA